MNTKENKPIEHLGCCGFNCSKCGAFSRNINGFEDQVRVSEKWKKLFDYTIAPEEVVCHGCHDIGEKAGPMIHADCEFRACASEKGLINCKSCRSSGDSCKKISDYVSGYVDVYEAVKDELDPGDAEAFFEPYMTNNRDK